MFAHLIDGDDVVVLQFRGRLRLAQEAAPGVWIRSQLGAHHLEGNQPFQLRIFGEVNRPHAALAK